MPTPEKTTPTRRGRPPRTDTRVQDMRQRIAAAARHLFTSEGYAAISMRRLATEVGCTPMTLYSYYENKIDVLRQLWSDILETVFTQIDQLASTINDPTERLEAISIAYVRYWLEHPEHYRVVFMSETVSQPQVNAFVEHAAAPARFLVFSATLAAIARPPVSIETLTLQTEALVCGLQGIAHNLVTISGYPWSSPESLVRTTLSHLLGNAATFEPT